MHSYRNYDVWRISIGCKYTQTGNCFFISHDFIEKLGPVFFNPAIFIVISGIQAMNNLDESYQGKCCLLLYAFVFGCRPLPPGTISIAESSLPVIFNSSLLYMFFQVNVVARKQYNSTSIYAMNYAPVFFLYSMSHHRMAAYFYVGYTS